MENQTELDQIEMESSEGIETHSEADERALIDELNNDDGEDFNPDKAVNQDSAKAMALESGKVAVVMGLGVVQQGVKQFVHQDFEFDEAGVDGVANAAAPLLVKYGGKLPPWLEPYKEEIALFAATGMLVFGSYMQIRELKAMDRAKLVEAEQTESEAKKAA